MSRKEKRHIFVERPCIGCVKPFKRWGVTSIALIDQFCSERCKYAFFHGYDLGYRVIRDIRHRRSF